MSKLADVEDWHVIIDINIKGESFLASILPLTSPSPLRLRCPSLG